MYTKYCIINCKSVLLPLSQVLLLKRCSWNKHVRLIAMFSLSLCVKRCASVYLSFEVEVPHSVERSTNHSQNYSHNKHNRGALTHTWTPSKCYEWDVDSRATFRLRKPASHVFSRLESRHLKRVTAEKCCNFSTQTFFTPLFLHEIIALSSIKAELWRQRCINVTTSSPAHRRDRK